MNITNAFTNFKEEEEAVEELAVLIKDHYLTLKHVDLREDLS